MQEWVTYYLEEVDRIEAFFLSNLNQLKNEFKKLE
jgi:hypothetical protein